jgi:hypothetical protein
MAKSDACDVAAVVTVAIGEGALGSTPTVTHPLDTNVVAAAIRYATGCVIARRAVHAKKAAQRAAFFVRADGGRSFPASGQKPRFSPTLKAQLCATLLSRPNPVASLKSNLAT